MFVLHSWYYSIPSQLSTDLPRLQARLYEMLLDGSLAKEDPRRALFRRIEALFPDLSLKHLDRFYINSYFVRMQSQPCMLVATMRILGRGLCTTQRYKSRPAGCALGCPALGEDDLDSVEHYVCCPRLASIFRYWLGPLFISSSWFPEGSPWLLPFLLLAPSPMSSNVLFAACVDALVALHNCRGLGIPGTAEQHFEARLRVTSRRHRALACA
eukprot:611589-Pyramimonas_sp.AAC.1